MQEIFQPQLSKQQSMLYFSVVNGIKTFLSPLSQTYSLSYRVLEILLKRLIRNSHIYLHDVYFQYLTIARILIRSETEKLLKLGMPLNIILKNAEGIIMIAHLLLI